MIYSKITDTLFVGSAPSLEDLHHLADLGVSLVINMRFEKRPHPDSPVPALWLPTFDSPLFWIPIRSLNRGVNSALETMEAGGKVFTHCHGGVHRAVAMGCCILIGQGYSSKEAMALVKERHPRADPDIWYIRRQIEGFGKRMNSG